MLEAINDFILRYCSGATQSMLYRGWQNRMALPATDKYIIYALERTERHGTNISDWNKTGTEVVHHQVLREYVYTIDLFGAGLESWANALEIAGESLEAVKFFSDYGCKNAYTDNLEYIPYTDLSNQYVERWRLRLHLLKWESLDIEQDFATEVVIDKLINVDEKR